MHSFFTLQLIVKLCIWLWFFMTGIPRFITIVNLYHCDIFSQNNVTLYFKLIKIYFIWRFLYQDHCYTAMTITIFNFCPASCYSLLTGLTPNLHYDLLQSIFPSKQSDPIKTSCSKLSIACACPYNKLQTLEQCMQGFHYCPTVTCSNSLLQPSLKCPAVSETPPH